MTAAVVGMIVGVVHTIAIVGQKSRKIHWLKIHQMTPAVVVVLEVKPNQ